MSLRRVASAGTKGSGCLALMEAEAPWDWHSEPELRREAEETAPRARLFFDSGGGSVINSVSDMLLRKRKAKGQLSFAQLPSRTRQATHSSSSVPANFLSIASSLGVTSGMLILVPLSTGGCIGSRAMGRVRRDLESPTGSSPEPVVSEVVL
jgi:hypothetical protein